jgi:hypothetical protein
MKKGKKLKRKINFSNRVVYFLVTLGICALLAVGVYAASAYAASGAGHNANEIDFGSGISLEGSSGDGTYGSFYLGNPRDMAFDGGSDGVFLIKNIADENGKIGKTYLLSDHVGISTLGTYSGFSLGTYLLDVNGNLNAKVLCVEGVCVNKQQMTSVLSSSNPCAAGESLGTTNANLGEDVYGGTSSGSSSTSDTCDGDKINQYGCSIDAATTCTDAWRTSTTNENGGTIYSYYKRTITCVKKSVVSCTASCSSSCLAANPSHCAGISYELCPGVTCVGILQPSCTDPATVCAGTAISSASGCGTCSAGTKPAAVWGDWSYGTCSSDYICQVGAKTGTRTCLSTGCGTGTCTKTDGTQASIGTKETGSFTCRGHVSCAG